MFLFFRTTFRIPESNFSTRDFPKQFFSLFYTVSTTAWWTRCWQIDWRRRRLDKWLGKYIWKKNLAHTFIPKHTLYFTFQNKKNLKHTCSTSNNVIIFLFECRVHFVWENVGFKSWRVECCGKWICLDIVLRVFCAFCCCCYGGSFSVKRVRTRLTFHCWIRHLA